MTESLIGAWSLQTWRITGPGGAGPTEPFGPQPRGQLLYSPDGWMSATVCSPDRRPFPPGTSPRRLDDGTIAAAFRSYFHYAGPYRVEDDRVIHTVRFALNPAMVGTEQVRAMRFENHLLILTGDEPVGVDVRRHELVWRRPQD